MKPVALVGLTAAATLVVSLGASYFIFKREQGAGTEAAVEAGKGDPVLGESAASATKPPASQSTLVEPDTTLVGPDAVQLQSRQKWVKEGQEAWDSHLKAIVLNTLKDPESAKFRCVSIVVNSDKRASVASIEVNAKNGYGGYTGYQCYDYVDGAGLIRSEVPPGFTCMCSNEASEPFRVPNP